MGRRSHVPICPTLQAIRTGKKANERVAKRGPGGEIAGWLDLYSFPLLDPDTGRMRGVIEYVRDISDHKMTEEALKRSEEEARKLAADKMVMAEIGRIIGSTLNIEEVYERFAQEARKLIDFDRIAINLINREKGIVVNAYVSGKEWRVEGPAIFFLWPGSLNEANSAHEEDLDRLPAGKEGAGKKNIPPWLRLIRPDFAP